MSAPNRFVVDTNAIVSAAILAASISRQAIDKVLEDGILLFSETTFSELTEVLFRSRFDHYTSVKERKLFLEQLARAAEFVATIQRISDCRDPDDDKFLELALNGRADVLITGDKDLLILNPWRGVEILTPAEYLER